VARVTEANASNDVVRDEEVAYLLVISRDAG